MSALRDRMIRDMTVRGFSPRTHGAYIRQVVGLARHYRRPPDQLSADEVQAYLAHLVQARKRSWSTCAQAAHAFRFLYHVTLGCAIRPGGGSARRSTARHVDPSPTRDRRVGPGPGRRRFCRLRPPLLLSRCWPVEAWGGFPRQPAPGGAGDAGDGGHRVGVRAGAGAPHAASEAAAGIAV